MQSFEKMPGMYTIEADPERYIKTGSFAVVSVIKLLEGIVAMMWAFRLVDYFSKGIPELAHPLEIFTILLPYDLSRLFIPAELPADRISTILFLVCAAAVLVLLIITAVEAILTIVLRFFMAGSRPLKYIQRVAFGGYLVLFICMVASVVLRAYQQLFPGSVKVVDIATDAANAASSLINGTTLDAADATRMLGELSELGDNARAALSSDYSILIIAGVTAVVLFFLVSYRWGLIEISRAVEYEFRLKFKELGIGKTHITRDTLLLGILFIAAAVLSGIKLGLGVWYVYFIGVIGLTYFFAYSCWSKFQLCHT